MCDFAIAGCEDELGAIAFVEWMILRSQIVEVRFRGDRFFGDG